MKERYNWIDYAKGISMCLVVLFHTHGPEAIQPIACIPKLAVFFFLAGMFARPEEYNGWAEFFRHKTLRLLIPYVCFNLITYAFWILIGSRYGSDAGGGEAWWKPLYGMLYGTSTTLIHYAPLWFLPCLIVTEILFYSIQRKTKGYVAVLLMVGIAAIGCVYSKIGPILLPWGIGSAMVMLPIYGAGYMLSDRVITIAKESKIWQVASSFAISTAVVMLMYVMNGYVRVSTVTLGNIGYAYIALIGTIIMILSLAMMMEKVNNYSFPCLRFIGQNTLIYLCLHMMFFTLIKGICFYAFRLPLSMFSTTIGCIGLTIGALVIGLPFVGVIKKYLPFLIGKR